MGSAIFAKVLNMRAAAALEKYECNLKRVISVVQDGYKYWQAEAKNRVVSLLFGIAPCVLKIRERLPDKHHWKSTRNAKFLTLYSYVPTEVCLWTDITCCSISHSNCISVDKASRISSCFGTEFLDTSVFEASLQDKRVFCTMQWQLFSHRSVLLPLMQQNWPQTSLHFKLCLQEALLRLK